MAEGSRASRMSCGWREWLGKVTRLEDRHQPRMAHPLKILTFPLQWRGNHWSTVQRKVQGRNHRLAVAVAKPVAKPGQPLQGGAGAWTRGPVGEPADAEPRTCRNPYAIPKDRRYSHGSHLGRGESRYFAQIVHKNKLQMGLGSACK